MRIVYPECGFMLIAIILCYVTLQAAVAFLICRFTFKNSIKQIAIVLLMLAVYAWTHWVNVAEIYKIAPAKYGVVFYNPIPLFVAAILALLVALQSRRSIRIVLYGALWLVVNGYFFSSAFYNPIHCQDKWDRICCLQTTDSTCAAAAAATLLKLSGMNATEEEMKNRCLASTHGTSFEGIYCGLAEKAEGAGKRVDVGVLTCDEFLEKNEAALVLVMLDDELNRRDKRYSRDWGWIVGTAHAVVVVARADANHIWVADPGTGLEKWELDGLRNLWRNTAVFVR
jgi:hypothetical protein